jgi:hypothetical protein
MADNTMLTATIIATDGKKRAPTIKRTTKSNTMIEHVLHILFEPGGP